jgi:hypothetical protein
MRSNRTLKFLAILMLAFFTPTVNGYAGSSSGGGKGGGGIGAGVGMGRGVDLSSGGNSGIGVGEVGSLGATHSYSSETATPGTSHIANSATNFGTLSGVTEPYANGIGHTGSKSRGHDDITMLGKDAGLSSRGPIKPIDPGLDMTKLGRLDTGPDKRRHYDGSQSTADSLDRDIKDFDAKLGLTPPPGDQGVAGRQPPDRIGRRGTRNAGTTNPELTIKQREEAESERQAILQEEQSQSQATIGLVTPGSPATTIGAPSPNPPAVTVSPPSTSTELTPSTTTDQTIQGQVEDTSAPLSASDLSALRSLFFPAGASPSALPSSQSTMGVGLDVGSTLSGDVELNPLPDVALTSSDAANLGYFYDGQSIVIADFKTRSVVGVLSSAS